MSPSLLFLIIVSYSHLSMKNHSVFFLFLLQGWYIVTYALGIYLLNQFIAFLTPKVDPAFQDQDDDGEYDKGVWFMGSLKM